MGPIVYHEVRDLAQSYQRDTTHPELRIRPYTSLDGAQAERKRSSDEPELQQLTRLPRGNRSMDNLADDPALEYTMARSRLRVVGPKQESIQGMPEGRRHRVSTMDELNNMLDDAIRNSSPKPPVSSDEQPSNLAPKAKFVLRRTSTRRSRHQSQSRSRFSQKTNKSTEPCDTENSVPAGSDCAYSGQPAPETLPSTTTASLDAQSIASHPKSTQASVSKVSPVKQRAALFEGLSKRDEPQGHDAVCHHFGYGHESPQDDYTYHHPRTTRMQAKKFHRIKFGDRIEERPATPLIPLTLPTLITKTKTSRPQSVEPNVEKPAQDDISRESNKSPSVAWPFKWGIFNKGNALPQESTPVSVGMDPKDEHYPSTRPSMVRNKVREILKAVEEKDDQEQKRRDAEKERLTRRTTRAHPPSRKPTLLKKFSIHEAAAETPIPVDPQSGGDSRSKPASVPEDATKTPLQRAMSEKQVFAPPTSGEYAEENPQSPQKPLPSTPIRGRPSLVQRPANEHAQSLERQFNLTPARSASRARPGVKVEVEIRDSPEREARERGDKVLIIRADVANLSDETA
jgi:hypothetical protein